MTVRIVIDLPDEYEDLLLEQYFRFKRLGFKDGFDEFVGGALISMLQIVANQSDDE